ncbi:hypothetical protein [Tenacibaculum sp.]|uniref:hypothetical protein n=1 Tax=Tenacibaculum sp. TaxID=1906242 RepID=UPI003D09933B
MKIKVYIGVIGSGKDYQAKRDCDVTMAFADQLREDVWTMIGWGPKTEAEYEAFKKAEFVPTTFLDNNYKSGVFTGRDLLQRYGTEVRRKEKSSHWVDILIKKLWMDVPTASTVGITDCRFPNEVKGLIEGVKKLNWGSSTLPVFELEFIHTNYKSDRYDTTSTHESERLAQHCLQFCGDNKAFQNYLKSL